MRDCLCDSPVRVDAHRPESMPNVTSVITRAIRKRLDWNTIGIAISVLMVTIAAVILVRLLRDIDVDKVIDALQAKPIQQIAIAGVFVAVAYLAVRHAVLGSITISSVPSLPVDLRYPVSQWQ